MKKEIAVKWVAALKSGKYNQAHGQLKDAKKLCSFCCLGVLTDLWLKENNEEWDGSFCINSNDSHLSDVVQQWAGMHSDNGQYSDDENSDEFDSGDYNLADINDKMTSSCPGVHKSDFEEIAEIINDEWEKL